MNAEFVCGQENGERQVLSISSISCAPKISRTRRTMSTVTSSFSTSEIQVSTAPKEQFPVPIKHTEITNVFRYADG